MYELIYYHPDKSFHYLVHTYVDKCNEVLASSNVTELIYLN